MRPPNLIACCMSGLSRVFALALAGLAACHGDILIEDWGLNVGFTLIVGTVRRADNTPTPGVSLSFSNCTEPVGGLLAATTTDANGRYRLEGRLPPGPPVNADTVRVRCEALTGSPQIVLDTIEVRFWRYRYAVVPTVIDFTLPP